MIDKRLSKKKVIISLLIILVILVGYVAFLEVDRTKNAAPSLTPIPVEFPHRAPDNPTNIPLVTNYTIFIPQVYGEWFYKKAVININFIAPSLSLQSEENGTISNYYVSTLPCTFSTVPYNGSVAGLLPSVFNGTTVEVKVDVYKYDAINPQPTLIGSNEWNITEEIFT